MASALGRALPFRVLRALARLVAAVLLALDLARISGEEAGLLERLAVLAVGEQQGARDAVTQSLGLGGDAAAVDVRHHVEAVPRVGHLEGLIDHHPRGLAPEIIIQTPTVDVELPLAGDQSHARDGGLATPRCPIGSFSFRHCSLPSIANAGINRRRSAPRAAAP